jgi:predicted Zn-dependent protease
VGIGQFAPPLSVIRVGLTCSSVMDDEHSGAPAGEPYDWYMRAQALVDSGNAAAAAQLLAHAIAAEPAAASIRELYSRALFDSRRFDESAQSFAVLVDLAPADDYARFGLGMSLWRLQEFTAAVDQLAAAVAMKPDNVSYQRALVQVRATLKARAQAGLPADGPLPPRALE